MLMMNQITKTRTRMYLDNKNGKYHDRTDDDESQSLYDMVIGRIY